jgi:hypothetical protein
MGAALALQSAAFVPQIEGAVAEGSFRNLREVTLDYAGLQQSAFLGKTLFRPAVLVAIWIAQPRAGSDSRTSLRKRRSPFAHFQYFSSAARTIAKSPADTPKRSSIQQSGPKELWNVPASGHEQAIKTAPAEFQRRVLGFFPLDKGLARPRTKSPANPTLLSVAITYRIC